MTLEMKPIWEIEADFFADRPVIANGLILVSKLVASKYWLTASALETGEQVWQFDTGGIFAPRFAVAGNVLYLATAQDRTSRIQAISLESHAIFWVRTISPSWHHFGPAKIMIRDDAVVAFADNGINEHVVYSLDRGTGVDVSAPLAVQHREDGFTIYNPETFYTRTANKLDIWKRPPGSAAYCNTTLLEAEKRIARCNPAEDTLCFALVQDNQDDIGSLVALNTSTKERMWDMPVIGWPQLVSANGEYLLFGHGYGRPVSLVRRDRLTGRPIWEMPVGDYYSIEGDFVRDMFLVSMITKPDSGILRINKTIGIDPKTGAEMFQLTRSLQTDSEAIIAASSDLAVIVSPRYLLTLDVNRLWRRRYGAFRFPATFSGYIIIASTTDSTVIAVDLASGRQNWSRSLPDTIVCAPSAAGSNVYVASRESVRALDLPTGNDVWVCPAPEGVTALVAVGELIVYAGRDKKVRAIDRNKALRWTIDTVDVSESGFASDGSAIYFGDNAGICYGYALDGNGWRLAISPVAVKITPLVAGELVFFSDVNGQLLAFRSGVPMFMPSAPSAGAYVGMSAVPQSDDILVAAANGVIRRLQSHGGAVVWTSDPVGSMRNPPAVIHGRVCVGSDLGMVGFLDVATGKSIRTVQLGGRGQAYPVAHNDAVVVVDEAGFMQALVP